MKTFSPAMTSLFLLCTLTSPVLAAGARPQAPQPTASAKKAAPVAKRSGMFMDASLGIHVAGHELDGEGLHFDSSFGYQWRSGFGLVFLRFAGARIDSEATNVLREMLDEDSDSAFDYVSIGAGMRYTLTRERVRLWGQLTFGWAGHLFFGSGASVQVAGGADLRLHTRSNGSSIWLGLRAGADFTSADALDRTYQPAHLGLAISSVL